MITNFFEIRREKKSLSVIWGCPWSLDERKNEAWISGQFPNFRLSEESLVVLQHDKWFLSEDKRPVIFSRLLKSGKENKKGFSMGDIVMTVYNASRNPQWSSTEWKHLGQHYWHENRDKLIKICFWGKYWCIVKGVIPGQLWVCYNSRVLNKWNTKILAEFIGLGNSLMLI